MTYCFSTAGCTSARAVTTAVGLDLCLHTCARHLSFRRQAYVQANYQADHIKQSKKRSVVSATPIDRRTLAQVIMQEDIRGLMQLLRGGASASETDSHGWNALHWSSSRGSTIMTHIILQETKPSEETGGAHVCWYLCRLCTRYLFTVLYCSVLRQNNDAVQIYL